jgi:hypothetical protein
LEEVALGITWSESAGGPNLTVVAKRKKLVAAELYLVA